MELEIFDIDFPSLFRLSNLFNPFSWKNTTQLLKILTESKLLQMISHVCWKYLILHRMAKRLHICSLAQCRLLRYAICMPCKTILERSVNCSVWILRQCLVFAFDHPGFFHQLALKADSCSQTWPKVETGISAPYLPGISLQLASQALCS